MLAGMRSSYVLVSIELIHIFRVQGTLMPLLIDWKNEVKDNINKGVIEVS